MTPENVTDAVKSQHMRRKGKTRNTETRRRDVRTPNTVAKRYTLPASVVRSLKRVAPMYGSQGRTLQVATELLVRLGKPLPLPPKTSETLTRMTYKIAPRTAELIDELTHTYETTSCVFSVCLDALNLKGLIWKRKA